MLSVPVQLRAEAAMKQDAIAKSRTEVIYVGGYSLDNFLGWKVKFNNRNPSGL